MNDFEMTVRIDWLEILAECNVNVQEQIKPFVKNSRTPQPDLGIGAGGDAIKPVDLAAEEAVVETIRKHDISFTLVSEESGIKEYGHDPRQFFVTTDPIDGTTNLVRGIPFSDTSIAISTKPTINCVCAGLVADLVHETVYTAEKGKGAYCGGGRIHPSKPTPLGEAVIGLDLNTYKVEQIAPRLTKLIQETKHIRHLGANALELCYVADGKTDAFIDLRGKLRTTDIAAAWLILTEAGGKMTTVQNEPLTAELSPKSRVSFIASGNTEMHRTILELINSGTEH